MLEWAEWRIWAPAWRWWRRRGVSDMDIGVCVHRGQFCFFWVGLDWIGSNRQREMMMMIEIEIEIEILQRNGQEEE